MLKDNDLSFGQSYFEESHLTLKIQALTSVVMFTLITPPKILTVTSLSSLDPSS